MIILDTNVLSEFMQSTPTSRVRDWLDAQPTDTIWTTSISVMELRSGVEILPSGKRRDHLGNSLDILITRLFVERILPFDLQAAEMSARIFAKRRGSGRPVEWRDAQIAGVALSRNARLATRNLRDFDAVGLELINPWNPA